MTWGTLWDPGNVLGATVVTVEAEPRLLTITDAEELKGVIHNCGLSCIITDLTLALAPANPWSQYVVTFLTFDCCAVARLLAYDDAVDVAHYAAGMADPQLLFANPVRIDAAPGGSGADASHAHTMGQEEIQRRVNGYGGILHWSSAPEGISTARLARTSLWNHTTLWAMKADSRWTYLQDQFIPDRAFEQLKLRKQRHGDDVLEHIEFMKFQGRMYPRDSALCAFTQKSSSGN
ncbi:MAG: hypothetical protein R2932_53115 [Caldilineaceae bacterium]